jgi:hypothetical protein
MLAAGSVVMVVGFLGCCGAARESKCMLGWVSRGNHVFCDAGFDYFDKVKIKLGSLSFSKYK